MGKLLTPLAIALILAVLYGHIHRYYFYTGRRRRKPGAHRYSEANCINMMWATVTPIEGESRKVPIWGYRPLEMGLL